MPSGREILKYMPNTHLIATHLLQLANLVQANELKQELRGIVNYPCSCPTSTTLIIVVLFYSNIEVE
jgi:hypothetical protein